MTIAARPERYPHNPCTHEMKPAGRCLRLRQARRHGSDQGRLLLAAHQLRVQKAQRRAAALSAADVANRHRPRSSTCHQVTACGLVRTAIAAPRRPRTGHHPSAAAKAPAHLAVHIGERTFSRSLSHGPATSQEVGQPTRHDRPAGRQRPPLWTPANTGRCGPDTVARPGRLSVSPATWSEPHRRRRHRPTRLPAQPSHPHRCPDPVSPASCRRSDRHSAGSPARSRPQSSDSP